MNEGDGRWLGKLGDGCLAKVSENSCVLLSGIEE